MNWRSHFALTKGQRNGIFILVGLIVLLQAAILFFSFFPWSSEEIPTETPEIIIYQQKLDSLKEARQNFRKDTIFPFNPNYLTDFKGYELGMSLEEIDRVKTFRQTGKWINSAEEFQQVAGLEDSSFQKIRPYLRFPDWVTTKTSRKFSASASEKSAASAVELVDLNSATAEDLQVVQGIGKVLSERIVKYRYRIGGFRSAIQLNDVYGLQPEVVQKITSRFQVKTMPAFELVDLDTASLDDLLRIPYIDEKLAREIINYRKLHEGISSIEELTKIPGFPSEKIDRIKLYLAKD
ncbi:MAG: helix-hairpin-helix domain-containing protein [Bacteroidota bacterium]|nr:helix-hairpin-helix domain-containing protein [Bacteroidota bacterium]